MSAFGRLLWVIGVLALVSLAPCATVLAVPPDAAAPTELAVKLPEAKHILVHQFEIYGWPNLIPMRAYLVSRCRALAELEPRSMGGGVVDGDFATNSELEYIRSPAQNPCPPR